VLEKQYPVWHEDFPKQFRDGTLEKSATYFTRRCSGCMYGSYPEISISYHYPLTMLERLGVFWKTRHPKPWPLTSEDLLGYIDEIVDAHPIDDSEMAMHLERLERHAEATQLINIGR
jgi:hypothetical protein